MILARSSRLLGQIFARAVAAQARRRVNGARTARAYFTVEIVTIIGLAAKDGILIIEFAKALRKRYAIKEATITACRMRFRPIVMTGLAFVFGVAPMIVASGASARADRTWNSRHGRHDRCGYPCACYGPGFLRAVQAAFSRQTRLELRAAGTDTQPRAQAADIVGG